MSLLCYSVFPVVEDFVHLFFNRRFARKQALCRHPPVLQDEFVCDVEVAVEIEAGFFVVEIGAGLALVEQFECAERRDVMRHSTMSSMTCSRLRVCSVS